MVEAGKILMIAGAVMIIVGALVMISGKVPFLGRLPGDILIRKDHFTFYAPIATSIIISILLSIIIRIFNR